MIEKIVAGIDAFLSLAVEQEEEAAVPEGSEEAKRQAAHRRHKNRRWRLVVCVGLLAGLFHVAWACGLLPGLPGFAMAGEVDQVKEELTTQIQAVDRKVDKVESKVDTILKLSIETRIRTLVEDRCNAPEGSSTRRNLQREIDGLQDEHVRITGMPYPFSCDDL